MTTQSNTPTNTAPQLAPTGHTRIMALAQYLGIHHQTLRGWIKQKKIPQPRIINGIKLFDNAEILAWLEESKQGSQSNKAEA